MARSYQRLGYFCSRVLERGFILCILRAVTNVIIPAIAMLSAEVAFERENEKTFIGTLLGQSC